MRKRSQTEVLGLVVVVLLISIGMLFAVRFVITKRASVTQQGFSYSQLASNMLGAILETNSADCRNTKLRELFADCYAFNTITCGISNIDACTYLNETIFYIFNETLNKWEVAYELEAHLTSQKPSVADLKKKICPVL